MRLALRIAPFAASAGRRSKGATWGGAVNGVCRSRVPFEPMGGPAEPMGAAKVEYWGSSIEPHGAPMGSNESNVLPPRWWDRRWAPLKQVEQCPRHQPEWGFNCTEASATFGCKGDVGAPWLAAEWPATVVAGLHTASLTMKGYLARGCGGTPNKQNYGGLNAMGKAEAWLQTRTFPEAFPFIG